MSPRERSGGERDETSAQPDTAPVGLTWHVLQLSEHLRRSIDGFSQSTSAPKTSTSSCEQPLVTRCCSVKVGVEFTRLITLTMRLTLLRSPTAACKVPIRSIAMARAAALPSSVAMFLPSWPTQGLPSFLAMWPETKTRLPVRTKGT